MANPDYLLHYWQRLQANNFDVSALLSGSKGCLTDDSFIYMPRDLSKYPKGIPISELIDKKDFYVYSYNIHTKMLELKKADGCYYVKTDDVYEIELTNGYTIKATGDHPFLLTSGVYKQLKDLDWKGHMSKNGKYYPNYRYVGGSLPINKHYTDRLMVIPIPIKYCYTQDTEKPKDHFMKIDFRNVNEKFYDNSACEHRFIMEQLYGPINNKIVHHKNGNHSDNSIDNLELTTITEHNYHHHKDRYFKPGNTVGSLKAGIKCRRREELVHIGTSEFSNLMSEKKKQFYKDPTKLIPYKEHQKLYRREINCLLMGGVIQGIKYMGKQKVYDIYNVQDNHNFIANGFVVSNSGKSSAALYLTMQYLEKFSFICPKCGNRFYKNVFASLNEDGKRPRFVIPHYIKDDKAWIQCPKEFQLDMKSGERKLVSGCGYEFKYSKRKKIKFEARKFVAYDNKDVVDKLFNSPIGSPIILDEAMSILAGMNHNKIEAKYLKNLLTVIRPRRYILFYNIPEASWLDSKVREGFTSFWLRMLERGVGVLFEKDKGENVDHYHVKEMGESMGVVKFFTDMKRIEQNLKKHPCFFDLFTFPEIQKDVYDEYEMVRNALTMQRQVEEMQLSNKDMAKIMTYNLIRNWDRIKIAVDRTKDAKLNYSILSTEILSDPLTRNVFASDMTARNWVKAVEDYIASKGQNTKAFEMTEVPGLNH